MTDLSELTQEDLDCLRQAQTMAITELKQFGSVLPKAIVDGEGHGAVLVAEGFSDDEAKYAFARMVKTAGIALHADRTLFSAESWAVDVKGKSKEEIKQLMDEWSGRISECPQRQEVMIVSLETHKASWMISYPMERPNGGDAILGVPKVIRMDPGQNEGTMGNLLPPRDVQEAARRSGEDKKAEALLLSVGIQVR